MAARVEQLQAGGLRWGDDPGHQARAAEGRTWTR
jgi:hypothetical protein